MFLRGSLVLFLSQREIIGKNLKTLFFQSPPDFRLDIIGPELAGIKQFPIKDGRYVVVLFKAEHFQGEVVSSDEGEMEWIEYDKLSEVNTVDDLEDLLKVINTPYLTEFQYVVNGDEWTVCLR